MWSWLSCSPCGMWKMYVDGVALIVSKTYGPLCSFYFNSCQRMCYCLLYLTLKLKKTIGSTVKEYTAYHVNMMNHFIMSCNSHVHVPTYMYAQVHEHVTLIHDHYIMSALSCSWHAWHLDLACNVCTCTCTCTWYVHACTWQGMHYPM